MSNEFMGGVYDGDSKRQELASDATIRDYFAAKALQGFLAGSMADGTPLGDRGDVDNITLTAYVIADSMLKARNQ